MKHEQPDHFEQNDIREVVARARPEQILRLLQDIGSRPQARDKDDVRAGNAQA